MDLSQEISETVDIPGLGGNIIAFRIGKRVEWALNVGWYNDRRGGRALLFEHQVDALRNKLGDALVRIRKLESEGIGGHYKEVISGRFSQPKLEIGIENGRVFLDLIFETMSAGNYSTVRFHSLCRRIKSEEIHSAMAGLQRVSQRGPELVITLQKLLPPTSNACFIATACLGDINHPTCQELRRFRDGILQQWAVGRVLIWTYYSGLGEYLSIIMSRSWLLTYVARILIVEPVAFLARLCNRIRETSGSLEEERGTD